jgi:hypothetical protein
VFSLINTAFQVTKEVNDIEVTQEDIDKMEETENPTPSPSEPKKEGQSEEVIDLDAQDEPEKI